MNASAFPDPRTFSYDLLLSYVLLHDVVFWPDTLLLSRILSYLDLFGELIKERAINISTDHNPLKSKVTIL